MRQQPYHPIYCRLGPRQRLVWLFFGLVWTVFPALSHADVRIKSVQILAPAFVKQRKEYKIFVQALKTRGLSFRRLVPNAPQKIRIRYASSGMISFRRGRFQRRYQLSDRLKTPQDRAQALVLFFDLFVRTSTRSLTRRRKARRRLRRRRQKRKKRRRRRAPGRRPLPSGRRNPKRRLVQDSQPKTRPKASAATRKATVRKRPKKNRSGTPKKRTLIARRLPTQSRKRGQGRTTLLPRRLFWGALLIAGQALLTGEEGGLPGGTLGVRLGLQRWSLLAEVSVRRFTFSETRVFHAYLMGFWLSWVPQPLRIGRTVLDIAILVGTQTHYYLFAKDRDFGSYTPAFAWGASVGSQVDWYVLTWLSITMRLSATYYLPQNFSAEALQQEAPTLFTGSLLLGIQFRL